MKKFPIKVCPATRFAPILGLDDHSGYSTGCRGCHQEQFVSLLSAVVCTVFPPVKSSLAVLGWFSMLLTKSLKFIITSSPGQLMKTDSGAKLWHQRCPMLRVKCQPGSAGVLEPKWAPSCSPETTDSGILCVGYAPQVSVAVSHVPITLRMSQFVQVALGPGPTDSQL